MYHFSGSRIFSIFAFAYLAFAFPATAQNSNKNANQNANQNNGGGEQGSDQNSAQNRFDKFEEVQAATNLRQQIIQLNFAESLFREKKYSNALVQLEEFIDLYPSSPQVIHALELCARIHEINQNYSKALRVYKKLFLEASASQAGVGYYYEQARILKIMGEKKAADKILQNIAVNYPDSMYARKARTDMDLDEVFDSSDPYSRNE